MATPRKRSPKASAARGATVTTAQLAEFLGGELPGQEEQISTALDLSLATAERFIARPLPDPLTHNLAQGVRLLAASLLLRNRLEEPVADADVPMLARYYWRLEA
jgi:hypothetical protein